MGRLVEGRWEDVWYDTKLNKGKFVRQSAAYRNWITATGEPGPRGEGGFEAEVSAIPLRQIGATDVQYAWPVGV